MDNDKITDVCICKYFHIFYMTDKTKMCEIYGECKPFTQKMDCRSCDKFIDSDKKE